MISIGCNIDNSYSAHAAVMLRSVIENIDNPNQRIDIYIIHKHLSEVNKTLLRLSLVNYRNSKLIFVKVSDSAVPEFSGRGFISSAAYYRLFLPYILDLDKILYLDSDLIVNTDVSRLWNTRLDNHYLAAVKLFDRRASVYYKRVFHIRCRDNDLFNTGVMLLNLKKMRRDINRWSIVNFIKSNIKKILSCDQDVFNVFYCLNWIRMPVRYNVDSGVYQVKGYKFTNYTEKEFYGAKNDPAIVHFTGSDKPWKYECNHPKKNLYYALLSRTAFRSVSEFRLKPYVINKMKGIIYRLTSLLPDGIYSYLYNRYL